MGQPLILGMEVITTMRQTKQRRMRKKQRMQRMHWSEEQEDEKEAVEVEDGDEDAAESVVSQWKGNILLFPTHRSIFSPTYPHPIIHLRCQTCVSPVRRSMGTRRRVTTLHPMTDGDRRYRTSICFPASLLIKVRIGNACFRSERGSV